MKTYILNNKIATLFLLIVLSVSSCSNVKYNGKLIDDVGQFVNESFASEHQVNTTFSKSDKPKKLFYEIDSDEKYKIVFKDEYKTDVDYGKQFLIVCSFVSIYKKKHYLDKLFLNNNTLVIECVHQKGADGSGYACAPYQRWCAILMDIIEYNTIDFTGE